MHQNEHISSQIEKYEISEMKWMWWNEMEEMKWDYIQSNEFSFKNEIEWK